MGRARVNQLFSLCVISLLCTVVLLQMLGVAVSFSDLTGPNDLFSTSMLEGFALLSPEPILSPSLRAMFASIGAERNYHYLLPAMVFHPPMSSH